MAEQTTPQTPPPALEPSTGRMGALEAQLRDDMARAGRRRRLSNIAAPILTAIGLVVAWQLLTVLLKVPDYLVPAPTGVVEALFQNLATLWEASLVTLSEILLGFVLSIVIGFPLAIAIFGSPAFGKAIYPILVSTQAIPKAAIAPLFIVWFGFGTLPKVLIAFLIAFFPIVIDTVVGLGSIEVEKLYLARSIGMGRLETFVKIRLPQALPSIFSGLKIAITLAVVGAVVGEFVGADAGLGYVLMKANGMLETPLLFAGLVCLTVIGVVLFAVVALVEQLVIPWHHEMGEKARGTS
jgi:NitT/TauT family transport system permease protein